MRHIYVLTILLLLPMSAYGQGGEMALGAHYTQNFEGFRSKPYRDSLGVLTIGYGFNCQYVNCKKAMSRSEAEIIFNRLYYKAVKKAEKFVGKTWRVLPLAEKIVYTDMAYNLGNRLFGFKRLQAAIKARDKRSVINEMKDSLWYNQVGRRGPALIKLIKEGV